MVKLRDYFKMKEISIEEKIRILEQLYELEKDKDKKLLILY